MKLKLSGLTLSEDAIVRAKHVVLNREDTRAEADLLFPNVAPEARKEARDLVEKLFLQAPMADTRSPILTKESAAKNVEEYFEKRAYLSDAQKNFPELLKVSSSNAEQSSRKVPDLKRKPGIMPVQNSISGGSA